jgi:prepilin-type N-terminal cleavage/methylation domain-containing protein
MKSRYSGFTMLEMLIVILILGIIAAFAIPQAYQAVKAYRLHSDAAAVAAELNVARFRAASQYAPDRVHVDPSTNSFYLERLCGDNSVPPGSTDPACSGGGATPYTSFSTPMIDGGVQYLSQGDSFTTTNPGGASCPPPAPESLLACGGQTDFYFNTRGMPVQYGGSPLPNGGQAIYLTNPTTGMTDAVVVTMGGRVAVYNWDSVAGAWATR